MIKVKSKFYWVQGIVLCSLLGFIALQVSPYMKQIGSVTLAILLGLLCGPFIKLSKAQQKGVSFCSKELLGFTVALLGLSLDFEVMNHLGWKTLSAIVCLVGATIFITLWIGKIFRLPPSLNLLIGIGSGICGSSAIAATAHLITSKKSDVALSIGIINLLGTSALFLTPLLFYYYPNLQGDEIGILIGGTLQAVGHVIAVGNFFDPQTASLALSIKMIRVSLLLPTVLCLSLWRVQKQKDKTNFFSSIPIYVYGFLFCVTVNYMNLIPPPIQIATKNLSHTTLVVAMAALGLGIKLTDFRNNLSRGFLLGGVIFLLQIIGLSLVI